MADSLPSAALSDSLAAAVEVLSGQHGFANVESVLA